MDVPPSLAEFWTVAAGARLFEDVMYGQWGLVLLSPDAARARTADFVKRRPRDALPGDLIVGHFSGDQELLLVRCDPGVPDYSQVLVALPLDRREDWYQAASDFGAFLIEYERAQGAKFWEELDWS